MDGQVGWSVWNTKISHAGPCELNNDNNVPRRVCARDDHRLDFGGARDDDDSDWSQDDDLMPSHFRRRYRLTRRRGLIQLKSDEKVQEWTTVNSLGRFQPRYELRCMMTKRRICLGRW